MDFPCDQPLKPPQGLVANAMFLQPCHGSVEIVGSRSVVSGRACRDLGNVVVAQSQKRSAVFDAITNPTNVTVEVNTASA